MPEDTIFGVGWNMTHGADVSKLAEFSKLTITRIAFDEAPKAKKEILKYLKTRSIAQELSKDKREVTWFFVPDTLCELVEKYPWLLDSNLGERTT